MSTIINAVIICECGPKRLAIGFAAKRRHLAKETRFLADYQIALTYKVST
jgi:hypothetical protein